MPPVNIPSSDYLIQQINLMQQQIQALQTQQQYVMVDKNGILRLQLGLLQNGDYGILMQDVSGNKQELLPAVSSYKASALTLTGFGPSALTDAPSVTCNIGASGNAKITLSSQIALPNSSGSISAFVLLQIDSGATFYGATGLNINQSASVQLGGSVCSVFTILDVTGGSPLAEGSHTFSLIFEAASSSSSNNTFFSETFLEVQPI
jgi:hypothetical protein